MTTTIDDILARVYGALKRITPSVYHLQAPSGDDSRYPYIVYSLVSDVPGVSGDDVEITHTATVRIHVVTRQGGYGVLLLQVYNAMNDLGFRRISTNEMKDTDNSIVCIVDFKIGVI